MASTKYKLIKEDGTNLKRIIALKDIPLLNIKKGDKGGLIEGTKNLSQEGNCWVYGDAQVSGNAQVYGSARVYNNARVSGNAQVYDNARVSCNAQVSGDARVFGDALVSCNAQVSGDARVFGDARVSYNARVFGNAQVSGDARVFGDAWVYDNARVFGDAWICGNFNVDYKVNNILLGKFTVTILKEGFQIGCVFVSIKKAKELTKKDLKEIHPEAINFYDKYSKVLLSLYKMSFE